MKWPGNVSWSSDIVERHEIDQLLELSKFWKDLSLDQFASTSHRSGTNARRNVRCVCCNQSRMNKETKSVECYYYLRNVEDYLTDVGNIFWRTIWRPSRRYIFSVWSYEWLSSYYNKDQSSLLPFGKKVLSGIFLGHALCTKKSEKRYIECRHWAGNLNVSEIHTRSPNAKKKWTFCSSYRRQIEKRQRVRVSTILTAKQIIQPFQEWRFQRWDKTSSTGRALVNEVRQTCYTT